MLFGGHILGLYHLPESTVIICAVVVFLPQVSHSKSKRLQEDHLCIYTDVFTNKFLVSELRVVVCGVR